jgi:hypothetical protein
MRIFKRIRHRASRPSGARDGVAYLGNEPVPMPGNPFGALQVVDRRRLPASAKVALTEARQNVKDQAERSRSEIAELVAEEQAQVAALVAETLKKSEDQIREIAKGGVEREVANVEEMEARLRKEISDTVKAEVAKTISELRAKTAKSKSEPKKGSAAKRPKRAKRSNASRSNGNGRAKTPA